MKIPDTGNKKALIIVDVQPDFLRPHNRYIIDTIVQLIQHVPYDLVIDTNFYVNEDSLWNKQQKWTMQADGDISTVSEIADALRGKELHTIRKSTRSVFKGEPALQPLLEEYGIEEVHFAGIATHDCVLASAFEAFDLGYPTYVLEECCESSTPGRHEQGITLMRYQNMTNNSCLAATKEYEFYSPRS